MKLFLLGIFLSLTLVGLSLGQAQEVTSPETLEQTYQRGVGEYQTKLYRESEATLFGIIEKDHASPLATQAVGFLKKILNESGAIDSAIKEYRSLQEQGEIKSSVPSPLIDGRNAFEVLKEPGKLEEHLFNLLKLGGLLAARTSLIGVVLDSFGLVSEAGFFFQRANQIVVDHQRAAFLDRRADQIHVRSSYFTWPEFYRDNIRLPWMVPGQVQLLPSSLTQAPITPDAWKVSANLSYTSQYDSNPVMVADGAILPGQVTKKSGMVNHYLFNLSGRKRINSKGGFGWDYILYSRGYVREDLGGYNLVSHIPSAFLTWTDQTSNEVTVRLDYAYTLHRKGVEDAYTRTFGPELIWTHDFGELYQIDLAYSYNQNSEDIVPDSTSDDRSGNRHNIDFRWSYPGNGNRLQPFFRYLWDRNFTDGPNQDYISHSVELGNTWKLMRGEASFTLATGLKRKVFTWSSNQRADLLKTLRGDFTSPPFFSVLTLWIAGTIDSQSSNEGSATYQRTAIYLGLLAHL